MLKDDHLNTCLQAENRHETTWKKKNEENLGQVALDVLNRDMKMVVLERKMADDRRQWRKTINDHCGDPR